MATVVAMQHYNHAKMPVAVTMVEFPPLMCTAYENILFEINTSYGYDVPPFPTHIAQRPESGERLYDENDIEVYIYDLEAFEEGTFPTVVNGDFKLVLMPKGAYKGSPDEDIEKEVADLGDFIVVCMCL